MTISAQKPHNRDRIHIKTKQSAGGAVRMNRDPLPDGSAVEDIGHASRMRDLPWTPTGNKVYSNDGRLVGTFDRAMDATYAARAASRYHRTLPDLLRCRYLVLAFETWADGGNEALDALLKRVPSRTWRQYLRDHGWSRLGPEAHWFPRGKENGPLYIEDRGGDDYLLSEEVADIATFEGRHLAQVAAHLLLLSVLRETPA